MAATSSPVARLAAALAASPVLDGALRRLAALPGPPLWIGAGAVAQTVWNAAHGYEPLHGIRDLDVVWHDPSDLTEEGEDAVAGQVAAALDGRPLELDAKNQARVQLWYPARFGRSVAPFASLDAAVATWPTTASAVAVRLDTGSHDAGSLAAGSLAAGSHDAGSHEDGRLAVCAPLDLDDLLALRVRPNRALVSREVYEAKTARWAERWPCLDIAGWDG